MTIIYIAKSWIENGELHRLIVSISITPATARARNIEYCHWWKLHKNSTNKCGRKWIFHFFNVNTKFDAVVWVRSVWIWHVLSQWTWKEENRKNILRVRDIMFSTIRIEQKKKKKEKNRKHVGNVIHRASEGKVNMNLYMCDKGKTESVNRQRPKYQTDSHFDAHTVNGTIFGWTMNHYRRRTYCKCQDIHKSIHGILFYSISIFIPSLFSTHIRYEKC